MVYDCYNILKKILQKSKYIRTIRLYKYVGSIFQIVYFYVKY